MAKRMSVSNFDLIMSMDNFTRKQIVIARKVMKDSVRNGSLSFSQYRLMNAHMSNNQKGTN